MTWRSERSRSCATCAGSPTTKMQSPGAVSTPRRCGGQLAVSVGGREATSRPFRWEPGGRGLRSAVAEPTRVTVGGHTRNHRQGKARTGTRRRAAYAGPGGVFLAGHGVSVAPPKSSTAPKKTQGARRSVATRWLDRPPEKKASGVTASLLSPCPSTSLGPSSCVGDWTGPRVIDEDGFLHHPR